MRGNNKEAGLHATPQSMGTERVANGQRLWSGGRGCWERHLAELLVAVLRILPGITGRAGHTCQTMGPRLARLALRMVAVRGLAEGAAVATWGRFPAVRPLTVAGNGRGVCAASWASVARRTWAIAGGDGEVGAAAPVASETRARTTVDEVLVARRTDLHMVHDAGKKRYVAGRQEKRKAEGGMCGRQGGRQEEASREQREVWIAGEGSEQTKRRGHPQEGLSWQVRQRGEEVGITCAYFPGGQDQRGSGPITKLPTASAVLLRKVGSWSQRTCGSVQGKRMSGQRGGSKTGQHHKRIAPSGSLC